MRRIVLVPAGAPEPALLHRLAADLRAHGHAVETGAPLAVPDAWRDAGTGRVSSVRLIHALLDREVPDAWLLAMSDAGLCAGEAGPVLGEAALGEGCAAVGIQPLREGSGVDAEVLGHRVLATALHELGHLAGAEHCRRASCVMHPSRNIADTDRKGTSYCADCAKAVQSAGKRKS